MDRIVDALVAASCVVGRSWFYRFLYCFYGILTNITVAANVVACSGSWLLQEYRTVYAFLRVFRQHRRTNSPGLERWRLAAMFAQPAQPAAYDVTNRQVYRRGQLLALCTAAGSKCTSYVSDIAALGLLWYRGTRSGALTRNRRSRANVYKHDQVGVGRVSDFVNTRSCIPEGDRYRNRTKRQRVLIPIACTADGRSLRVGVLNVRPLGNKAATVSDMIVYNSFDLFAVVESCRHDSAESPSVIASTPPGYRVFERSRTRTRAMTLATHHGGICVCASWYSG